MHLSAGWMAFCVDSLLVCRSDVHPLHLFEHVRRGNSVYYIFCSHTTVIILCMHSGKFNSNSRFWVLKPGVHAGVIWMWNLYVFSFCDSIYFEFHILERKNSLNNDENMKKKILAVLSCGSWSSDFLEFGSVFPLTLERRSVSVLYKDSVRTAL
jgi:hypothetical protein